MDNISLKMNSRPIHNHQVYRFQWMSIAILAIATIGFTAQTPTKLVIRNPAPIASSRPKREWTCYKIQKITEADKFYFILAVLGWNSFWPFGCGKDVNDKNLKWQADLMAEKGFIKAGYKTFIIECGWEVDPKNKPELLVSVCSFFYFFKND
jgi:hypothetical protein